MEQNKNSSWLSPGCIFISWSSLFQVLGWELGLEEEVLVILPSGNGIKSSSHACSHKSVWCYDLPCSALLKSPSTPLPPTRPFHSQNAQPSQNAFIFLSATLFNVFICRLQILCVILHFGIPSLQKKKKKFCFLWDVNVTKMSFKLHVDVGMVEVTASHSYCLFLETFQLGFDWKFCHGNVSCRMSILPLLLRLQKQPLIESCLNFLEFGDIKGLLLGIYGNKLHWWTITAKTKDHEKTKTWQKA